MKRWITLAVAAIAAAFALAGCGTALDADTAGGVAAVPGYNSIGEERVGVRNAMLVYPGPQGYKTGSEAAVDMRLFNNTNQTVQVVVKSNDASVKDGQLSIPPQGMIAPNVKLTGLRKDVNFSDAIEITVEFVGIKEFTVPLNIAPPSAPRA